MVKNGAYAALVFLFLTNEAQAYIGPGAGLGAIVAVLATLVGFVLLVAGTLWFPIRRKIRNRKMNAQKPNAESTE